jgi:hypothetical protein
MDDHVTQIRESIDDVVECGQELLIEHDRLGVAVFEHVVEDVAAGCIVHGEFDDAGLRHPEPRIDVGDGVLHHQRTVLAGREPETGETGADAVGPVVDLRV